MSTFVDFFFSSNGEGSTGTIQQSSRDEAV